MIQASEDLGFALKPGEPIRVIGEGVRHDLQRDLAVGVIQTHWNLWFL